jgi:hypothetical protein
MSTPHAGVATLEDAVLLVALEAIVNPEVPVQTETLQLPLLLVRSNLLRLHLPVPKPKQRPPQPKILMAGPPYQQRRQRAVAQAASK